MKISKKYCFTTISLFLILIINQTFAQTQNIQYCDSVIQEATNVLYKKDHAKSLELYTQTRILAEKNNWQYQIYQSILGIGNNYYEMLDYGEALNYFLESYIIAVKSLEPKDEIASLNNIANLYTKQKLYEKAKEYYLKAYEIADEKKVNFRKGLPLMNIGYIYNKLNEPKKARPYILQSMNYLEDNFLLSSRILLIENDLLLGSTGEARESARKLLEESNDENRDTMSMFLWIIISKSYLSEKNHPLAVEYAKKVLSQEIPLDIKRDIFELLSEIYRSSKNFEEVSIYKDSIIALDFKLNEIKNGSLFNNNKVKFEIQNYKNQITANEEKRTAERKIFISTLAFITSIVVIIALIFRQKKLKTQQNMDLVALNFEKEKSHNLLLEKQISNALLEQERLKNEIETKNRKLSAKALYLSDRNKLIEEIIIYLSKKPKYAKDTTLSSHLQSLKSNLRIDNEWNDFIIHFEEVNRGFLTRLKNLHPTLNANDIKFIAYIYMNLSVKEISSILNITIIACKKRKERLALKMNLSKDEELFDYISTL